LNDRLPILDIWVDPVNRDEATRRVRAFLKEGNRPHAIFAANPEKNCTVPKDPLLYEIYKNADVLLPDGMGVVMAARMLHGADIKRVPGSEFIFDLCRLAIEEKCGVFIYGSREEVSARSVEKLKSLFPDLIIAGRANGYLDESEMNQLIEHINASRARILFIALGSPKQEKWFAAHKDELKHIRVVQAIGGTLDTIAGNVRRAPEGWRRMNLEWLYRLLTEPQRVYRQGVLPLFAVRILLKAGILRSVKALCGLIP
jgi:N-acetylglucosaminyldiphosphoundecaprenol N-acetyl-beta-D-mannosaminyltransferase